MSKWKIPAIIAASVVALSGAIAGTAIAQPAHPAARSTAVADSHHAKPTIVLIHGAFADGSSWSSEINELEHDGYQAIAPALPLRGVATDSAYVTAIVRNISGPVILVGHSYGGEIATEVAANDPQQITGIVYAAAYIPQAGENALGLTTQFPGSLLGPDTTYTVNFDGGSDTYIKPSAFHALFAGDRTASQAAVGAATQRPIASSALTENAAASLPAGIPLFAIVASQDKAIPPAAEKFMAQRAGATIYTVNSAHDLPVSHPQTVVSIVERAAR
jgi:pimeloyl-ACP methyl ester carboxylesterase